MRFLARGLIGLALLGATIALVAVGAMRLYDASQGAEDQRRGGPRERSFAVSTAIVELTEIAPETVAYGEIEGWRTLELRAATEGEIVDVAPNFRDGAAVAAGDLLFLIDPADAETALADREAALAEAEAERAEAVEGLTAAELELAATDRQRALSEAAMARQAELKQRGFATEAAVEDAEMALAGAEQTVSARRAAMQAAAKRVERAGLSIRRAEIALAEARRRLADTRHVAAFDGLLSEVNAVLGRRVTGNERMGVLIDPAALEARFEVSNAEFARLIGADGALLPLEVSVALDLGERRLETAGRLVRSSATAERASGGRVVYARLDAGPETVLRPGDFVAVTIREPAMRDVAVLPADAATQDGRIFVLDDDSRLREARVAIERRIGDRIVVSGAPPGATYVVDRLPQLGVGVKVTATPLGPDGAPAPAAPDLVSLSEDERARLIAFVEGSDRMPDEAKARVLSELSGPLAPRDLVERLRERMGRRG